MMLFGFTAHHDVAEYRDSPALKIFHGEVGMTFDHPGQPVDRRDRPDRVLTGCSKPREMPIQESKGFAR